MYGPSWISRNLRLFTVYSRDTVTKMKDWANFKNVELWTSHCVIYNSLKEKNWIFIFETKWKPETFSKGVRLKLYFQGGQGKISQRVIPVKTSLRGGGGEGHA